VARQDENLTGGVGRIGYPPVSETSELELSESESQKPRVSGSDEILSRSDRFNFSRGHKKNRRLIVIN